VKGKHAVMASARRADAVAAELAATKQELAATKREAAKAATLQISLDVALAAVIKLQAVVDGVDTARCAALRADAAAAAQDHAASIGQIVAEVRVVLKRTGAWDAFMRGVDDTKWIGSEMHTATQQIFGGDESREFRRGLAHMRGAIADAERRHL